MKMLSLTNVTIVSNLEVPKAVHDLREIVAKTNGVLVATPEYNGCLSPIIKNAFEWLSSDMQKKKVGVIGASYIGPDAINDVRTVCENISANCFSQYFYVNLKSKAFNP